MKDNLKASQEDDPKALQEDNLTGGQPHKTQGKFTGR